MIGKHSFTPRDDNNEVCECGFLAFEPMHDRLKPPYPQNTNQPKELDVADLKLDEPHKYARSVAIDNQGLCVCGRGQLDDIHDNVTNTWHKDITNKPNWSLIPWEALEEVLKVLEFGAAKYSPNNWRFANNSQAYKEAAFRHTLSMLRNRDLDNESHLATAAHAIACLLFVISLEQYSNLNEQLKETLNDGQEDLP